MFRNATVLAGVSALATVLVSASAAVAAPAPQLDVYAGDVPRAALSKLVALGVDRSELDLSAAKAGAKGTVHVEAILSGRQAAELAGEGVTLTPKEIDGQTVTQRATAEVAAGLNVYRKYSGPGGLKEEYELIARRHPLITKLVKIGKSTNGVDIIALKVSLGAPLLKDGAKPSTLYMSAQHAREWITPEMNRRLMHYYVDGYRRNRQVTNLINTTELWFVPVSNPDGYDFTFEPGQRLWRKNLRDNNGDGVIAPGDGVDPNRNFDYKWGYDNEGSSEDPASETYRGPGPNSEPESKALDNLFKRVGGFTEFVNYHSAAQLLLYGAGWQVNTPTPDDLLGIAMAGDDAHPAVPGYDPDIAAELYTTNGEVDSYFVEKYGAFGFTPEMSTCAAASDSVPDDEWVAEDCLSDFNFPDDEDLIQAEFEKNIPFALAVAESAKDPDDPVSVVGRKAPDFEVDSFDVSYGDPQTVAVTAKRAISKLQLNYTINGGKTKTASVSEFKGGERYGDENDHYYAEFRGQVKGTKVGDKVKVWFSGSKRDRWRDDDVESASFTYTVKGMGAKVLVIADEDRNGVNPTFPNPPGGGLQYGNVHVNAVRAAGYTADLWDTDTQGVPHDLGVLSHYKAIVWYMGDNRITQDPEDFFTTTPFGNLPDASVAEREQYLTIAVRDFLNEGGKLINAAETAQFSGYPGITDVVGGLYYGLDGAPDQECVITAVAGFFDECLLLADDFRQYYLGAMNRVSLTATPDFADGVAAPINGYHGELAGTPSNPIDEGGLFQPTTEVLPPAEFPQFASSKGAAKFNFTGNPFAPIDGTRYAGALHADQSYTRLTRTIDLSGVTAAQAPKLTFQLSINTEPSYDNVIVEAHTPGADNWTTLPDANGGSQTDPPAECTANGFLLALHPSLRHYLGGADCSAAGTSGRWNSFTGSSQGWEQVAIDLSAYAGQQVEVSIAYVTDPGGGGVGAFVDDTKLVATAGTVWADSFEGETSSWSVTGPPAGSPPNSTEFEIGLTPPEFFAGTSTDDTLLLGFGLEQVAAPADRAKLVKQALSGLGVR